MTGSVIVSEVDAHLYVVLGKPENACLMGNWYHSMYNTSWGVSQTEVIVTKLNRTCMVSYFRLL